MGTIPELQATEEIAVKTRPFIEWSNMGYQIRKGSKTVGKNEHGECLFDETQVIPPHKRKGFVDSDDWDMMEDYRGYSGGLNGDPM